MVKPGNLQPMNHYHINEEELYKSVLAQLQEIFTRARKQQELNPIFLSAIEGAVLQVKERGRGQQRLYLLGEAHYSPKPVEYAHTYLVPKIKQNPLSWLFLVEDNEEQKEMEDPAVFYFQQLARLYSIPVEEALVNIHSPAGREEIAKSAGVPEKYIDLLFMEIMFGTSNADYYATKKDQFVREAAFTLESTTDYIEQLLQLITDLGGWPAVAKITDKVGQEWNNCSQRRLANMCTRYAHKTNILISVGAEHLPAFQ